MKCKMPTEQYGQTQVLERRFTRAEILKIVKENIIERMGTSYDFDYKNPIILEDNGELIFRYVQSAITMENNLKTVDIKPLKKGIKE